MEPRIQYAQTEDGVSIAYEARGRGPPLVQVGSPSLSPFSATEPGPAIEELAEDFTVVRYDGRGSGLSQREAADFSLEARLLDLEAVIERTQSASFALGGAQNGGMTAIAYAARHRDRLTGLILFNAYASGARYLEESPAGRFMAALQEIALEQWESVTLAWANRAIQPANPDRAAELAALLRASMTPEAAIQFRDATRQIDVTHLLKEVAAPTLVLHQENGLYPLILSQEIASGIPNASIVVTQRPQTPVVLGDAGVRAIKAFLGAAPADAPSSAAAPSAASAVHTILFTDIGSSTALSQRLGDAPAQEVRRAHNAIVRQALRAHGGSEIKHTGDGIMASFPSASHALECAVAIQRGVAIRDDPHLHVHVGLNAGEPIAEEADLFGTSVDLARRICDEAEDAEILVSDVIRQLAAGKGFLFADRGSVALRGFEDPVRLYEVPWRE